MHDGGKEPRLYIVCIIKPPQKTYTVHPSPHAQAGVWLDAGESRYNRLPPATAADEYPVRIGNLKLLHVLDSTIMHTCGSYRQYPALNFPRLIRVACLPNEIVVDISYTQ